MTIFKWKLDACLRKSSKQKQHPILGPVIFDTDSSSYKEQDANEITFLAHQCLLIKVRIFVPNLRCNKKRSVKITNHISNVLKLE